MFGKRWKKLLAASLIVGTLTFAPAIYDAENFSAVNAEVKLYTAMGVDYGNELESQEIVKLRARDKAIKNAVKQAGVGLKTYSRSVNAELTDDEILTITSNAYELVGEPKYNRVIKQVSDQITLIVWEVTVDVNVDDGEITKWYNRDDKERSTLISQTRETNEAAAENERKVEDLRKRANNVTDEAGRAQLKKEFEQADNEFLSNQKLEEGNQLAYKGEFTKSIKLFTEAIELNPNNAAAYYAKGTRYYSLSIGNKNDTKKFHALAVADLSKAIELKPDYWEVYITRAFVHYNMKNFDKCIEDFNRAVEIAPNKAQSYYSRSFYYQFVAKDNARALADLNKAVELEPNNAECYTTRAVFYEITKNYDRAIYDLNKAVELAPNNHRTYAARARFYISSLIDSASRDYKRATEDYTRAIELEQRENMLALYYFGRGGCYKELKMYDKAITDYTQAIELGAENENIQNLLPHIYSTRGKCYQELKLYDKAIADYTKAILLWERGEAYKLSIALAYENRGQCYEALGDKDKAQADFKKYKELKRSEV